MLVLDCPSFMFNQRQLEQLERDTQGPTEVTMIPGILQYIILLQFELSAGGLDGMLCVQPHSGVARSSRDLTFLLL